ncbi:MAG: RICIN domain-containing protein [Nostoc sp.]|uniref:RICIN domain-containing protein n=1 Tax=Nostoc sp. TaxID=1180 RepID=UPI002FF7D97D
MLKKLASSSIALGVLFFSTVTASYPSIAFEHGVNFTVRSKLNNQYCLDASLDKNQEGREVYIYKCHGRENQRWTFTDGADNSSAVVGLFGLCLDIRGRSVRDNTPVQLWRCHYGANQQFQVTSVGQIRELQSGKCLTISKPGDRQPVFIDDCEKKDLHQLWLLHR